MNTLTTTQAKPSALSAMSHRINVEPAKLLSTLKETVFKGASDNELLALVVVANEYRLNPFLREIYAFPGRNGAGIVPIVSIDGWIKILNSQPSYDGIEFSFDEQNGKLISCTATIYIKNRNHPVKVTEFFSECSRNTDPWKGMPRRMMRHKALIQAARVAFGFSGIFDEDEARDVMQNARVVVSQDAPAKPNFALPSKVAKAVEVEPEAEVQNEAQDETEPAEPEGEKSPNFRLLEAIGVIGISERKYMQFAREKHNVSGDTINGLSEDDAVNLLDRLEEDSVELETIIASSARRSK